MSAAKSLLIVAVASVGGGVVGALTVSLSNRAAAPAGEDPAPAAEVVDERLGKLERRLETVEKRPARSRRRSAEASAASDDAAHAAPPGDDGEPPRRRSLLDGAGPEETEAFVAAVEAAIEEIKARREAGQADRRRGQDRERYLRDMALKLNNYRDKLELSDAEFEQFKEIGEQVVAEVQDARAGGADRTALAGLRRKNQRRVRSLLGDERYRKYRSLELDRAARPVIVDAANNAGVSTGQREQIESLLKDHIDRVVDLDVRLNSEEMSDEARGVLHDDMNQANRAAWDRLRLEILTEEQRGRVPTRRR